MSFCIEYLGAELIDGDLRRLKNYSSLEKDIENSFNIWKNLFSEYQQTTDNQVYHDSNSIYGFEAKIGISCFRRSRQEGARLWYALLKGKGKLFYLPVILFDCREEKDFKKHICLKIFKERVDGFRNGSLCCPDEFKTK